MNYKALTEIKKLMKKLRPDIYYIPHTEITII